MERCSSWITECLKSIEEKKRVIIEGDKHNMSCIAPASVQPENGVFSCELLKYFYIQLCYFYGYNRRQYIYRYIPKFLACQAHFRFGTVYLQVNGLKQAVAGIRCIYFAQMHNLSS